MAFNDSSLPALMRDHRNVRARSPATPQLRLILCALIVALAMGTSDAAREQASPPCDTQVQPAPPRLAPMTLADAARPLGLAVGSAASYYLPWPVATRYKSVLAHEFSLLTPANEMKWSVVHPQRDRYDFERADCLVRFAQDNGLYVRGHTLAWHNQIPPWVGELNIPRDAWIELLHDHIRTVVGHFRANFPGRVVQWDVVNEPISDEGCNGKDRCALRSTLWSQKIGGEYVELAFRFAHEADPAAKLYLNETGMEFRGEHADARRRALFRLLDALRELQVPIDGVGVQAHVSADESMAPTELPALLEGIAARGLDIAITEADVRLAAAAPVGPAELERQATRFRDVLDACLDQPRCKTFVLWGFTDLGQWLNLAAAPLDAAFQPKPAWGALIDALNRRLPVSAPAVPDATAMPEPAETP